jgi:O-antigen/teichoic acid export membrane protein
VATAVQSVAQVASGVGLSAALIRQAGDPTRRQQRAVAGFLFATGIAFTAMMQAIAFLALPAAGVDGNSIEVVAATTLAVPVYALRAVPMVLLERHLRFGRVALVETAETLSFNAFALVGALVGLGAFSLAGAVPVAAAAGLLCAWALTRPSAGLSFDLAAVRPLAHFGMRASLLQILTLARGLGFVSLITAIGGTTTAGFYAMGSRLFSLPTALASAMQRVSFPALARSPAERPRRAARAATLSATLASLPLAMLAGSSHALVTVVLGDRWLPTVNFVLTSAPGVLLAASAIPAMVALALSEGRPTVPIASVICSALVMAVLTVAAVPSLGTTGVGMAMSGSTLVGLAVLGFTAEPEMRVAAMPLARALATGSFAAAIGYLAPFADSLAGLILQLTLVAAIWSALAALAMRDDLRSALRIARPMLTARMGDGAAD